MKNFFNLANGLLALVLILLTHAAVAQTTFKIATVVPDGTGWMKTMRAGTKTIEERTEGRVKFKIYGGGVQGNDKQIRRKMRVGQLHGGVFTSGGLRAFQRDAELYGLPMLFRDYAEVKYVRERMDAEIYRRLADAGFVTFGYAGGGFAYLISNSPVAKKSDMGKLKVWIPEGDQVAATATAALGVTPVTLPVTDVLTGLQTELIDTVMGPPVGVIVMQWHTAMSHITDLPLSYAYAGLLIEDEHFNKVNEADQAIVREVMTAIYRGFDDQGAADDKSAYAALVDEGLEPVKVSMDETSAWETLFQQANLQSAEDGVFDIQLLRTLQCHLEAYRSQNTGATCS